MWWMRAVGIVRLAGALGGLEALFYGAPGRRWCRCCARLPAVAASGWPWRGSAMEVLRSGWPFSGMPWGRLAFAVVDTPWRRRCAYVGATGVSLLLALLGRLARRAGPARRTPPAGSRGRRRSWRRPSLLPCPRCGPGDADARTARLRVAAVQGDVPGDGTDVLARLPAGHRQPRRRPPSTWPTTSTPGERRAPDFVLWPENSTAVDPFADAADPHRHPRRRPRRSAYRSWSGRSSTPAPSTCSTRASSGTRSSARGDRYTKRHPVPFGEYIPWRNVFGDSFGKLDMIPRDMRQRHPRASPLRVAGAQVADAICFDVAYDDGLYDQVDHGAEMVVVQTSNAMFIHTAQIEQQFEISRAAGDRDSAATSRSPRSTAAPASSRPTARSSTSAEPRTTSVLDGRRRRSTPRSPPAPGSATGSGRLAGPVDGSGHGRRRCSAIVGAPIRATARRRPTTTPRPRPRAAARAGDDHEQ